MSERNDDGTLLPEHVTDEGRELVTPVEERIDHAEAKRIAERLTTPVNVAWDRRMADNPSTMILARAYLALLTEHDLRRALEQIRGWTNHVQGCERPDDSTCAACIADSELARHDEALALAEKPHACREDADERMAELLRYRKTLEDLAGYERIVTPCDDRQCFECQAAKKARAALTPDEGADPSVEEEG